MTLATLDADAETLLGILSGESASIEDIARHAGLTTGAAAGALMLLEIRGQARRMAGNCYILANRP